ncbi:MAG: hypothetical protein H7332_08995 [Bdellovibrionales bacterium]|nr:hypothetical protein [Ramlibacter sp.]
MGLMDILQTALAEGRPEQHFDEVANAATQDELSAGLAGAMRSDETPPFGDMVGQLFGHSNPNQQAGLLNQILASLGPGVLSGVAGGVLGKILAPGQTQLTPDQASQLSPDQIKDIATHAEKEQPGIIDEVSSFYAQHSGLIKMLGGAALAITMAKIKQNATSR